MAKLSVLTREIKAYAKNRNISDEDFLNAFLNTIVTTCHVRNKVGEALYLNKTRTSDLMNRVDDVPGVLREALSMIGLEEKMLDEMKNFINDFLDSGREDVLRTQLHNLLDRDENISKTEKDKMKSLPLENLLVKLLLVAIAESNLDEEQSNIIWKKGKNCVKVVSGDLFKYGFGNRKKTKNIIVIPVNTAFDTHITRRLEEDPVPLVSETTIHGQWLTRMQKSGVSEEELYKRIVMSLQRFGTSSIGIAENPKGRQPIYPIGSIAIVESKNASYFLVAISDFDKQNIAHSTAENIDKSVEALLEKYNAVGQGYDLYLPILGTGRSRTGLSIGEAFSLLKESFMAHADLIQGQIIVVARPEDIEEIDLRAGGKLKSSSPLRSQAAEK